MGKKWRSPSPFSSQFSREIAAGSFFFIAFAPERFLSPPPPYYFRPLLRDGALNFRETFSLLFPTSPFLHFSLLHSLTMVYFNPSFATSWNVIVPQMEEQNIRIPGLLPPFKNNSVQKFSVQNFWTAFNVQRSKFDSVILSLGSFFGKKILKNFAARCFVPNSNIGAIF